MKSPTSSKHTVEDHRLHDLGFDVCLICEERATAVVPMIIRVDRPLSTKDLCLIYDSDHRRSI
jgi:hypothetical protein